MSSPKPLSKLSAVAEPVADAVADAPVDAPATDDAPVETEKKVVGEKLTEMKISKEGEMKIETNWTTTVPTFDEMGLKDNLLRGIYAYGFEKPSAIQARGIMPILAGHDTIAQAQSGTGKTATFSISVLQQMDINLVKVQALLLAPTRELAQQIQKVIYALGVYLKITSHACVGGTLVRDDIKILSTGVHIVVGTPGRVYDMINRKVLDLRNVRMFVLDESDEMLSRGFKDQVRLVGGDVMWCGAMGERLGFLRRDNLS